MNDPKRQAWPDGTRVCFTAEAREAMQAQPGTKPLRAPALGPNTFYTIDNTDDSLHDVLLRETGERYGTYWLQSAEREPVDPASALLEELFDRELPASFDPARGTKSIVRDDRAGKTGARTATAAVPRGNWMQTYTGRQFYPLDPRPEDVDITDIAHALSMQCRYNGHVRRFMSVAEHCVLLSHLVAPEHALWALLHDATEAYVGDMVRPLKLHMPEYRAVENGVMVAIAARFSIDPTMPAEVKQADSRMLLDERSALLGEPAGDWEIEGEPFGVDIQAWGPDVAELEYLLRFAELTGDPSGLPVGLCGDREDHLPHAHRSTSLGLLWCSADHESRLPWAAERQQNAEGQKT
ncbi:hypothetical protein ACFVVC_02060 [Pseudarthrobacter sp. NPDC058196]|uniref:hypothetical protein n=1 Tax=Pseudarthrobacter sp. NPDC058196 TaxID=3346376 RepID=UPI0036D90868